jgi:outer membrane lipoprotein SlyB
MFRRVRAAARTEAVMFRRTAALAVALPLALGGCYTTRTTQRTTTWDDRTSEYALRGHVEGVRETVTRTEGNPAGGAVAGALVGGLLGSTFGGHTHYDRWGRAYYHGSGLGALFGAGVGAAVGAAASGGPAVEDRWYDVVVRFDDGSRRAYPYHGRPPFQPGDAVWLTESGLVAEAQ